MLFRSVIPALVFPKIIMKGIKSGKLKKHAELFNYTNAMFMSKTIYAMMWLSDYPNTIIQSRDIKWSYLFYGFFH